MTIVALVLAACAPVDESGSAQGGITAPSRPATGTDVIGTVGLSPSTNPITSDASTIPGGSQCGEYREHDDLPLQRCDKGDLVRSVQAELNNALAIALDADGFFGNQTEDAVKRFQSDQGLVPDGLVGPATWNALFGSNLTDGGPTGGLDESWFGLPAAEAVAALRDEGFVVIEYEVCSSSVGPGAVRQIVAGDGTIYADAGGVSDAGAALPLGSVIEVKVGNGLSC